MDVDTLHPSPLQDLFLHWMSLPSTEHFIKQQLHSLRSPASPSTAMRDEDETESHKTRNGERRSSSDKGSSGRGAAEDEEEDASGRAKFVINIPADDATPACSAATSLSSSPALLPSSAASPPALSGSNSPASLSPSHSPPHSSPPAQPHRVALRVDTDTRFASPTNTSSSTSTSTTSHSPPLSPKSPARQSPPASHSPDPSQHSPHKKRKSNNTNSPSASPATSPSSASTAAFATSPSSSTVTSPSASRVATASPPKSPRAATPPRSPVTRSPSASNLASADRSVESGLDKLGSDAIRRFYYREGQPCSAEVRRKDERRIRRLFRKAIQKEKLAEERKRAGEEEKEEEPDEEATDETEAATVEDDSEDVDASGDDESLALRCEQLYPLTTAVCGFSSYCLAAGSRIALANGTSMAIESIVDDRPTPLLSYDAQQHGCVHQPTEGAHLLRQGVKACVELLFDDGQTLLCTADHRIRTLRGDVQAQHLTADDRVVAAPEGPLVVFDATDDWTLPLQLSADGPPLRLRMAVRAEWERCMAFARLLGFTSANTSGRTLQLSHVLDAQSVAADIAVVLGRTCDGLLRSSAGSDVVSAASVEVPAALDCALAAHRADAATFALPDIVTATGTPTAFIREYLGGLFGASGAAPSLPEASAQKWTAVKCCVPCNNRPSATMHDELASLLEAVGVDAALAECESSNATGSTVTVSCIVSFADNIGFRYSVAKQQRLSLAARWHRSLSITAIPQRSIADYLDACGAASIFLSPAVKSSGAVLSAWHVGLVSRRPVGSLPTYDLSVRDTHLFIANGLCVHNCHNALFSALLLHAKQHFPQYYKHDAVDDSDSSLSAKPHDEHEEKSTPTSSDMDTTKDNGGGSANTSGAASTSQPSTPSASAAAASAATSSALVHVETFLSYYFTHLQPFDPPTRFFRLLLTAASPTLPSAQPYHLTRDHFKPLVSEIVNRHPGLEFLHSTPEFQFKYAQTVIARIFYAVNSSGNERLTLHELRASNLLLMLSLLDSEDDINKLNDYFSYEHFYVIYCISEGTLVNLADGTSVPIEQVRGAQDSVLSYAAATATQEEGLVPRQVTRVSDMGVKECVELLFSDGRTLCCTPDHRIRTADGRWVEAGALRLGVDDVAVGLEYPDSTLGAPLTAEWRLDLQASLGYTLDMAQRARHSLAFARLLGYLLSDGTVNDDYSVWYIGHQLDADAVQRDVLLLTGVAPTVTADTRTLQMSAPRPLHRAFQHVGVEGGKRTSRVTNFPAFLTAADCPLPLVREFLGGLFGGDGCTLRVGHGGGIARLQGLGFVATRSGDVAEQQQALLQQELFALLQRVDVDTNAINTCFMLVAPNTYSEEGAAEYSELQAAGAKLTPTVTVTTLDPTQRYWLRFFFNAAGATSFARRVGFRYSCHKQQRLSAALAYYRANERYLEQKRHLSARTLKLRGEPPTRRIADALQQAKAELSRDQQLMPRIAAWRPTQVNQLLALSRFNNDNVEKQLQAMNSRRFCSAPRTQMPYRGSHADGDELDECYWCADTHWEQEGNPMLLCDGQGCEQCGHLMCFLASDALASTRRFVKDEPEGAWFCPDCEPATYGDEEEDEDGVHSDARVLPLFRVRLVGRRAVGARHVYDLTVPSEQGDHTASFTASGVVVHNCKFWELDSDHDGFIDQSDLATYDDYSLTAKLVERVIGGHGRPLLSTQPGKMNYLDFIVFLVSEVDKASRVSIAYWFNALDLDGDGQLTSYEMEHFFDEQKQRIQALSQEQITFVDILCQLVDMIKGGDGAGTDLLPVPHNSGAVSQLGLAAAMRLREASGVLFDKKVLGASALAPQFFNTLFNLNKFIQSEQRDPVRIKQIHDTPQLSDWDRYAISGYYRLAEVDTDGDALDEQGEDGGEAVEEGGELVEGGGLGEEEERAEDEERAGWQKRMGAGSAGRHRGDDEAGDVYVRESDEETADEEDGLGMDVDEQGAHSDAHMSDGQHDEAKEAD